MPPRPRAGSSDRLSYILLGGLSLNFAAGLFLYFTQPKPGRSDAQIEEALERARIAREAALASTDRCAAVGSGPLPAPGLARSLRHRLGRLFGHLFTVWCRAVAMYAPDGSRRPATWRAPLPLLQLRSPHPVRRGSAKTRPRPQEAVALRRAAMTAIQNAATYDRWRGASAAARPAARAAAQRCAPRAARLAGRP